MDMFNVQWFLYILWGRMKMKPEEQLKYIYYDELIRYILIIAQIKSKLSEQTNRNTISISRNWIQTKSEYSNVKQ